MPDKLIQRLGLSRVQSKKGYIRVLISFDIPSNVNGLQVQIPRNTQVETASGFDHTGSGGLTSGAGASWDGREPNPEIEVLVSSGRRRSSTADTGEWGIVEAPNLLTKWQSVGKKPEFEKEIFVRDEGVAGTDGSLVYLGPYIEHSEEASGQKIRLIEPMEASLRETPREILEALKFAARELPVNGKDDEVVCIAAPTKPVNWGPGGVHAGGNAYWARDSSRLNKPNNTWTHEYVHTRQEFGVDPSMKWFVEASAVYYATHLAHKEGRISDKEYHASLNTTACEKDILASPRSWSSSHVPYQKGSRIAAWIDKKLRDSGGVTLSEVFSEMNITSDGKTTTPSFLSGMMRGKKAIGYEEFKEMMRRLSSHSAVSSFEHKMDNFVNSGQIPEEVPPAGIDEIPEGPMPETDMPIDITKLIEKAFGEEFGEEIAKGDGRVDEDSAFGGGIEGSVIEEEDIFEGVFSELDSIHHSGDDRPETKSIGNTGIEIEDTGTGINVTTFADTDNLRVKENKKEAIISGDDISLGDGSRIKVSSSGGIRVTGNVSVRHRD